MLKITWSATSPNGIASQTVQVDDSLIRPVSGPYGGLYYSCLIGIWTVGSHTYKITSTDSKGVSGTSSGTFVVVAPANTGPTISGVVASQAREE